jgi:hypothetical protein
LSKTTRRIRDLEVGHVTNFSLMAAKPPRSIGGTKQRELAMDAKTYQVTIKPPKGAAHFVMKITAANKGAAIQAAVAFAKECGEVVLGGKLTVIEVAA